MEKETNLKFSEEYSGLCYNEAKIAFIAKNRRYHNEMRAFIKEFSYLKLKLRRYCC